MPATVLGAADRQQAGLFLVHATDDDGESLVVKVYGRDAHDSALVSTLWRTVWYREAGSPLRLGRLQQVEHEAFLTLFAGQAGVHTETVVTAGATEDDDALLVLRRRGVPLPPTYSDVDGPTASAGSGQVLERLHHAGIAHGQVDDAAPGSSTTTSSACVDFRGATVAATDAQRRTDEVQALVTTVALVGEDARHRRWPSERGGAEGWPPMLPYLQRPTLTPLQRRAAPGRGSTWTLRGAVAAGRRHRPPS